RIWLSSVLTLTTLSRPRRSRPICSTAGETIRHGPHQGAQKSTSTGSGESSTTPLKSASPASVSQGSASLHLPQTGAPVAAVSTRFLVSHWGQLTVTAENSYPLFGGVIPSFRRTGLATR